MTRKKHSQQPNKRPSRLPAKGSPNWLGNRPLLLAAAAVAVVGLFFAFRMVPASGGSTTSSLVSSKCVRCHQKPPIAPGRFDSARATRIVDRMRVTKGVQLTSAERQQLIDYLTQR